MLFIERVFDGFLVAAILVTNLVGIDGRAASACYRADSRALPAANHSAEERAAHNAARRRNLVTMLFPERTVITIALVIILALYHSAVVTPSRLRARGHRHEAEQNQTH